MPVWPGDPDFKIYSLQRLRDGGAANISGIECGVHTGTHVDAPWHFLDDGATVERLPLDVLVGPAVVAFLPVVNEITAADLEALALPEGTRRLLLRTRNSGLWASGVTGFRRDFAALTGDAAAWLVQRGVRLIGIDYLSVQRFEDSYETHRTLLAAGIVIVEGLNLDGVNPGDYDLACLPLKIDGADGSPARVVLIRPEDSGALP
jgi:arylformamidase